MNNHSNLIDLLYDYNEPELLLDSYGNEHRDLVLNKEQLGRDIGFTVAESLCEALDIELDKEDIKLLSDYMADYFNELNDKYRKEVLDRNDV